MRISSFLVGLVIAAVACRITHAQTQSVVNAAYEQLPAITPPSTPAPLVQPATMEATIVDGQPWPPPHTDVTSGTPNMCTASSQACESFWFGAIELPNFQASFSQGSVTINDNESSIGPRGIIGWESARGLGFRTRFWGLQNENELFSDLVGPIDVEIRANRFDFDVYRRFYFVSSDITIGGSITAAELQFDLDSVPSFEDEGGGVGFFVEGRHGFYQTPVSQWSVISRGRWAGLVGTWTDENRPIRTEGDSNMQILEADLGVEFKRKFRSFDFVFQHCVEVQSWETTYTGDVNFLGQTISFGFAK